jgi:hypothetical protein
MPSELEFMTCFQCDYFTTHSLELIRDAKPEESTEPGAKNYEYECTVCSNKRNKLEFHLPKDKYDINPNSITQ